MDIPFIKKDAFGPEYVVFVHDSKIGMEGILVIDNTAQGPGKGGIRMTPDITPEEVFRLARTMTWKNAILGIPFGGAKAGIVWKGGTNQLKKQYIQTFAKTIKVFTPKKYIAGPDVNTGEREMQWFAEATGNWRSATGKPANLCMKIFGKPGEKCGIPHEFGSAGFGVAEATAVAADFAGIELKKSKVAIHGFGNVGSFVYTFLTKLGARVVAIADKNGAIFSEQGFEAKKLKLLIKERKSIVEYRGGIRIESDDFWNLLVDIIIPASVTDVIDEKNKNLIQAKIIVEAGNISIREHTEEELFQKGILIVPDLIANAGGVISSFAEYRGYNPKRMFEIVKEKITQNTKFILEESKKRNRSPRVLAQEIARENIERAARKREKFLEKAEKKQIL